MRCDEPSDGLSSRDKRAVVAGLYAAEIEAAVVGDWTS